MASFQGATSAVPHILGKESKVWTSFTDLFTWLSITATWDFSQTVSVLFIYLHDIKSCFNMCNWERNYPFSHVSPNRENRTHSITWHSTVLILKSVSLLSCKELRNITAWDNDKMVIDKTVASVLWLFCEQDIRHSIIFGLIGGAWQHLCDVFPQCSLSNIPPVSGRLFWKLSQQVAT